MSFIKISKNAQYYNGIRYKNRVFIMENTFFHYFLFIYYYLFNINVYV